MSDRAADDLRARIYQVVGQVLHGAVSTYGDIAAIVGDGCDARAVGYALNEIPKGSESTIPWQRIVNRAGGISTRGPLQRRLLENEGIVFDARGRVDMTRYRWRGPSAEWAAAHGFTPLPAPPGDEEGEQLRLF